MKMTHADLVKHLDSISVRYTLSGGKIVVEAWCAFSMLSSKFTELPDNVVFNDLCNLKNTPFESIPEDTVFRSTVFFEKNRFMPTLPVLNIGSNFFLFDDMRIPEGTYVDHRLVSRCDMYSHIDNVDINGYFVESGLLS